MLVGAPWAWLEQTCDLRRSLPRTERVLETLMGWLRRRIDRDGQASALERVQLPSDVLRSQDAAPSRGRRDVLPGSPHDVLDRGLASKVLQGWLENRQQTLVPLTLRLDKLGDVSVSTLMRFAAVAGLAGTHSEPGRQAATISRLRSIGADERAVREFVTALERDCPLSPLIRAIRADRLEPQAYAIAVMATDQRQPAGRLFANYIAARLGLTPDAVRSVDRRYRR
jgi:hypothetical protein